MKLGNNISKRILFLLVIVLIVLAFSSLASATKVLHIGASHTIGSYGTTLDSSLRSSFGSFNVWTAAVCVARAEHFVKGKGSNCGTQFTDETGPTTSKSSFKISNLISSFNPNIVIVSLGANFHTTKGVNTDESNIKSILNSIGNRACFWVGAPVANNKKIIEKGYNPVYPEQINPALEKLVGTQCTFIDPVPFTNTKDLGDDGLHFKDATNWASMVHTIVIAGRGTITKGTPSATGLSSGGPSQPSTPTQVSPTANIAGCNSLTTCKEIDDVWSQITLVDSNFVSWKNKVWDPINTMFKDYNSYYGLSTPGTSTTTPTVTEQEIDALKGKSVSEVKNFINTRLGSKYEQDIDYLARILSIEIDSSCSNKWRRENGAVAQTAINRVHSSSWGSSVKGVVASDSWNAGFSTKVPATSGLDDTAKRGCVISALKFMLCVGEEDIGAKMIGGRTFFANVAKVGLKSWLTNPLKVELHTFGGKDTSPKKCDWRAYDGAFVSPISSSTGTGPILTAKQAPSTSALVEAINAIGQGQNICCGNWLSRVYKWLDYKYLYDKKITYSTLDELSKTKGVPIGYNDNRPGGGHALILLGCGSGADWWLNKLSQYNTKGVSKIKENQCLVISYSGVGTSSFAQKIIFNVYSRYTPYRSDAQIVTVHPWTFLCEGSDKDPSYGANEEPWTRNWNPVGSPYYKNSCK